MIRLVCILAAAILLPGPGPVGGAAVAAQRAPEATRGADVTQVPIPAGSYTPAFAAADAPPVRVEAFTLDARAVTVAEYLAFVEAHPEWRRSAAPAVAGPNP